MTTALQATAFGWTILSLAHTVTAKDWQSNAKFQSLPRTARACAKAGWYQGSAFFLMNALVNYAWSTNPTLMRDPIHQAIAGLMAAIMWASAWWYGKHGILGNMVAVGVMGALQTYSAFSG